MPPYRKTSYYQFLEDENKYEVNLGLYTQNFVLQNSGQPFEFIISSFAEGGNINRAVLNDLENTYSKSSFKVYYTIQTVE